MITYITNDIEYQPFGKWHVYSRLTTILSSSANEQHLTQADELMFLNTTQVGNAVPTFARESTGESYCSITRRPEKRSPSIEY